MGKNNKLFDCIYNIFRFLNKSYRIILIVLILSTIAVYQVKLFNVDLFLDSTEKSVVAQYSLDDVNLLFPEATSYENHSDSVNVYKGGEKIGLVINSSPLSDSIVGYASSVPVLIGVDNTNKLVGVLMLKNTESPSFVKKLKDEGFMNSWNNVYVNNVLSEKVDAVSGATKTSKAIINTVNYRLSKHLNSIAHPVRDIDYWNLTKMIFAAILLLLGVFQFFILKR
ncbi:MAG: FMN-binding protein [Marinifilaceae bacterium]